VGFELASPGAQLTARSDAEYLEVSATECLECHRILLELDHGQFVISGRLATTIPEEKERMIWPVGSGLTAPKEVPHEIAADYREAAQTLSLSPKASAAM